MMAHVPEDILLLIFDAISPGPSCTTDPTHFPASAERAHNSTLAACALVCRSWAPHAQAALFRHIYLTRTTDVIYTANFWPVVQRSTNALLSLISALERDQPTVKTLHVGLGEIWEPGERGEVDLWRDDDDDVDSEDADHGPLVAAHLSLVARAISLCAPGLVRLSLYIGTPFDRPDVLFTPADLASITSNSESLRELAFYNLAEEVHADWHVVYRGHHPLPHFALGCQLITAVQAQLTALTINFAAESCRCMLVLPNLHSFRMGVMPSHLEISEEHPRAMKVCMKVCLRASSGWWEDIPITTRHLCLHSLLTGGAQNRDLKRFALLETLEIDDAREAVMVRVVRSAAGMKALHTVTLRAALISSQDTVSQLRDIFAALPALERVVLVGRRVGDVDYSEIASPPVAVTYA